LDKTFIVIMSTFGAFLLCRLGSVVLLFFIMVLTICVPFFIFVITALLLAVMFCVCVASGF